MKMCYSLVHNNTKIKGNEVCIMEKCRSCGHDHSDISKVVFRRNHVSNRMLPYCSYCMRRLYKVPYRPV